MRGRVFSVVAVVLLHLVIAAGFLWGVVITPLEKAKPAPAEIVLPLSLPPTANRTSAAPAKGAERRGLALSPSATPSPFFSPGAAAEKLGTALFGCTPEKMATLDRKEREKCERQTGFNYTAFAGLPMKLTPPPDKLSNGDIAARFRNTADPCMAAKATGTECIHEILYGKALP